MLHRSPIIPTNLRGRCDGGVEVDTDTPQYYTLKALSLGLERAFLQAPWISMSASLELRGVRANGVQQCLRWLQGRVVSCLRINPEHYA